MARFPNRLHERRTFFKYMTARVANIVLNTHKLRWSSPLLFDDPFDVPRELSFGIAAKELATAVGNRCIALIRNPPDDLTHLSFALRFIVGSAKERNSPELTAALVESIHEALAEMNPTEDSMEEFRRMWRGSLPQFRVLCLCGRNDSASMWLHYAERYQGVVIELETSDERDSAWLMAREVKYSDEIQDVHTAEGWAKYITMGAELSVPQILLDATYNKASDRGYEHEWRVASFAREGNTELFSDYGFNPRDIVAIYFGPSMEEELKGVFMDLLKDLPWVRVFDTVIMLSRGFEFEERARAKNWSARRR